MTLALVILFGVIVGIALGALGAGGSILIVPALVYGLSVAPIEATKLSQVIIGLASAFTAVFHGRAGDVRWKTALLLALLGAGGAVAGRMLVKMVSGSLVMMALALVLIVTAALMLRRSYSAPARVDQEPPEDTPPGGPLEDNQAVSEAPPRTAGGDLFATIATGVSVGFLTGFLGVGGGFLTVPMLVLVLQLPMKAAAGTSLIVISLNCAAALLYDGVADVRWNLAIPFTLTSMISSLIALRATRNLSNSALQRAFALFVILLGILILATNIASGPR